MAKIGIEKRSPRLTETDLANSLGTPSTIVTSARPAPGQNEKPAGGNRTPTPAQSELFPLPYITNEDKSGHPSGAVPLATKTGTRTTLHTRDAKPIVQWTPSQPPN